MTSRFLKFLIGYGIVIMIAWTVFTAWVLPLLPDDGIKGGLSVLGYGVILIMIALVTIGLYERNVKDDDRL